MTTNPKAKAIQTIRFGITETAEATNDYVKDWYQARVAGQIGLAYAIDLITSGEYEALTKDLSRAYLTAAVV